MNPTLKPCIIIRNNDRYEAYNEDGRLFASSTKRMLVWPASGYESISLNSRLGKTIMDKLPLNIQMKQKGH